MRTFPDCEFLVITGMHRSHTSMLARLLEGAGVEIGSELIAKNEANPYGHFEDVDFVRLHERILAENGRDWRASDTSPVTVSDEMERRAIELVEERSGAGHDCWGFKVPHATLLLDFWARFPGARFLLVYREPLSVLRSLLKRTGRQLYYKPYVPFQFARTYEVYNCLIETFYRSEARERVYLIDGRDLLSAPEKVIRDALDRVAMPQPKPVDTSLVDREIVARRGTPLVEFLAGRFAKSTAVAHSYESLAALADSRAVVKGGRAGGGSGQ